jgi:hypothetical protein
MTYHGIVRNGVVVFNGDDTPPEGVTVEVRPTGGPPHDATDNRSKPRALFDLRHFVVHAGVSDLAAQHDHYLYGLPKVGDES